MINNKVLENELKDTEKQIEELLLRIKQLRKEVHDMLPPDVKKVIHERVVLDRKKIEGDYIDLNKYLHLEHNDIKIKNYVRYYYNKLAIFNYNKTKFRLSENTTKKEIILTYIPSKNIVLMVELWQLQN